MTTITVNGMKCGGCAANVTKAITAADLGARVEIDLKARAVHVHGERDVAAIRLAIARAGYEVVA